jgi:hypothetical protein
MKDEIGREVGREKFLVITNDIMKIEEKEND